VLSRVESWTQHDRILRNGMKSGMDSDFDNDMDGLRGVIPDFDRSCFTSKDIVPIKAQNGLASALSSKCSSYGSEVCHDH